MEDRQFRQLLDHFGYSWEGYRKVRRGVKKRIGRHMQQLGCRTLDEYFQSIDKDEELKTHFECLMTVSVTRFFRDLFLWRIIEGQILPAIVQEDKKKVKLWFAGCSCGEEVYSFKIVWESLRGRLDPIPKLEIWATDINPVYLRRAQDGIYPSSSVKEVPHSARKIYFILHAEDDLYRLVPSLKNGILWKVQDVLFELGEVDFQIIFLRNSLLTYYKDEIKQSAFRKVMGCLAEEGFLIIGSHEKLPIGSKDLVPFSTQPYIFKKVRH